jgi:hypothetical protein
LSPEGRIAATQIEDPHALDRSEHLQQGRLFDKLVRASRAETMRALRLEDSIVVIERATLVRYIFVACAHLKASLPRIRSWLGIDRWPRRTALVDYPRRWWLSPGRTCAR